MLFRLIGPGILFLVDGLTYIVSAIAEAFVRLPPPPAVPKTAGWREAGADFWRELKAGLRYVAGRKGLRYLLFLSPLESFFMITIVVLLPFFLEDFLHVRPDWYGFLVGGLRRRLLPRQHHGRRHQHDGAEADLGLPGLRAGHRSRRGRLRLRPFALAGDGPALRGGADGGLQHHPLAEPGAAHHAAEIRGRVLGLFETLGLSSMPIAAGTAGIVADLLHRNIPLVYLGCGVGLLIVAVIQLAKPEVREFLSYEGTPEEEAAALAGGASRLTPTNP